VIDPGQLTFDILGNAISVALPGVLWAVLFLCAFEHAPFAESVGLGRRAFWLLLPGAIAATLADLPFVPISNAEGLHKGLPKSKLDVLDCGHFAWEDGAAEYGRLASEWIQGGYARL